jgi:hypothetical protein
MPAKQNTVTAMPMPSNIPGCLAELSRVMKSIEKYEAQTAPLYAREKELREHLLNTFTKTELEGAKGSGLSVAIVRSVVPQIDNWDEFFKFAVKKGNQDLIQRSISSPAWRERVNNEVAIPGVSSFTRVALRVTAR